MKTAIYCRVSTEDQEPKHQEKAIKKYAKDHGFSICKVYTDKISGTKSTRPALNDLMIAARSNKFNVVLVWKLDRLGRSLQHLLNVLKEWEKLNIDFISITEAFDTTTAQGRLFFQIAGAFAEFESQLISERTKLGLKNNRRVGKRG
ncbi:MAG: hypothetical protein GF375_00930, partial [Candidatus Omnitrophica bacterium]|nr:hypothetical protein [Candidatus Omnitrophota bacterium]